MSGEILIGPVRLNKRDGFLNPNGEFAVPPVFEQLGRFREGLASFKQAGKFGFINARGDVAIPPVFESDRLEGPVFSDGLAAVGKNGKVGYINHAGAWVVHEKFDAGWDFMGGKALVLLNSGRTGHVHGVIDNLGTVLSTFDVYEVPYNSDFPTDWEAFGCHFCFGETLLVGWLNWRGEVVFAPRYPRMTNFFKGVAGFVGRDDSPEPVMGLVDWSGNVLREPAFLRMGGFDEEGTAAAGRTAREMGFINWRGDWLIEPVYRQASAFSEGLACVTVVDGARKSKKGFINRKGDMVIEPRFHRQASFHQGFAQVEYDGKQAVIDMEGRVIWEAALDPER